MKNQKVLLAAIAVMFIYITSISCGSNDQKKGIHETEDFAGGPKGKRDVTSGPVTLRFGAKTSGSCSGKGICGASAALRGVIGDTFDATASTNTIVIQFDSTLIEAGSNYPHSSTYAFDAPYDVSANNPIFSSNTSANWPYTGTVVIPAETIFNVTNSGSEKLFNLTAVTAAPQSVQIVLGNSDADGNLTSDMNFGLYSITPAPTPAVPPAKGSNYFTVPASFPATLALKPGASDTAMIYFPASNLTNYMNTSTSVWQNFFTNGTSSSGLSQNRFAYLQKAWCTALGLPQSTFISNLSSFRLSTNNTYDTIFFNYMYVPLVYNIDITCVQQTSSSLQLSFTAPTPPPFYTYKYDVQYSINPNGPFQSRTDSSKNIAGGPSTCIISGLTASTKYFIRVGVQYAKNGLPSNITPLYYTPANAYFTANTQ